MSRATPATSSISTAWQPAWASSAPHVRGPWLRASAAGTAPDRVRKDQALLLRNQLHGIGVEFHPINWLMVRAAPIEIQLPVIILEKVGIPELEASGNALEGLRQRIFRAAEIAVLPNGRGTQIEEAIDRADIGRTANAGRFCLAWFRP